MASLYEKVLREVEALSEAEQLRLVAQVSARLHGRALSEYLPASSICRGLEERSGVDRMLRNT